MDSFMLQDDGVRDRIRQAEEFLVPSMNLLFPAHIGVLPWLTSLPQMTLMPEVTDRTSF